MLVQIVTENGQKKVIPLTADAGAGNPVGSLISMYKKSSPSGYLYCDGSTFDQTQYPLLYAYLGSNVLPDYREFALVGAEENTTDVYNASTNPTGTIHDHDVYTEGQAKDDQLQEHKHSLKQFDIKEGTGTAYTLVDYTANINDTTDNNVYTYNTANARKGTVTRGKRKAVYFYIKATSGLSENAQDNVLAQFKEYTRNQNILADPETITISTNSSSPTIMEYDGFIVEQLKKENQNEYITYSINGNSYLMQKNASVGITTANMTIPYKKGDSVYISSIGYHEANARVMQYKLRDYTGR